MSIVNSTLKYPQQTVFIPDHTSSIEGDLTIPPDSWGIVLFAHGPESSRFSSQNRFVANYLQSHGLATLLLDLLTRQEEVNDMQTAQYRFDIPLLSNRLVSATDWLSTQPETKNLRTGYFGASSGAAAMLVAASQRPLNVQAIVSRGGRPDLATTHLQDVQTPTLLLVGNKDNLVVEMNLKALERLQVEKKMILVHGASHHFEEPGTIQEVARLTYLWFAKHLNATQEVNDSQFYENQLFQGWS